MTDEADELKDYDLTPNTNVEPLTPDEAQALEDQLNGEGSDIHGTTYTTK